MADTTVDLDRIRDASLALVRAMETFRYETPADLITAVREYAAVTAALNERLRSAHVLLRQGRTADALHACETEPNVLDCVAELDAADQAVDAWRATLEEMSIACPERLLYDAASELNAAYDVKHQLAHLMRTHRLLAIGQGPLEERVATLRAIARLNPENPVWIEDLAAYEEQCKKELESELVELGRVPADEVTEAVVARARRIVKELSDASWQEPLPAQSVHRAETIVARLRADQARIEMEGLASRLVAAHADGDFERAESLCDRWEKCEKRAQLGPEHALSQQTSECREWIRGGRAEQTAALELQASMEQVVGAISQPAAWTPWQARPIRNQLHLALQQLESHQFEAPENEDAIALSSAARQRLTALDRVPLIFFSIAGVAAILLVAGIGLAGGGMWRATHRGAVITDVRERVAQLVEEERFAEAKAEWQKAVDKHPWLENGSRYQIVGEMKKLFSSWDDTATDGLERVDALVDGVRRAMEVEIPQDLAVLNEAARVDGMIPPAAFTARAAAVGKVESLRRDLGRADAELAAVEKRRSPESVVDRRAELLDLAGDVEDVGRQVSLKTKAVWEVRTTALDGDLAALTRLKDDELAERQGEVPLLRKRIEDIERFADRRQEVLRDAITTLEERIERVVVRKELRQQLTNAAQRGLEDFMEELAKRKAVLSEAGIRDADEVEESKPAIEAALAWAEVGKAWLPDLRGSGEQATRLRDALAKARSGGMQPAGDDALEEKLDLVLAVLEDPDREGINCLKPLKDYLGNAIMRPEVLQAVINGKKYYTRLPERKQGGYFFEENKINSETRKLGSLGEAEDYEVIAAPHVKWVKSLRETMAGIQAGRVGVEEGILSMMETASTREKVAGIDPLLVCRLLTLMANTACSRVMLAEVANLEAIADQIAAKVGAEPEWVDPAKRNSKLEPDASKWLEGGEVAQGVRDGRAKIQAIAARPAVCRQVQFVGWVEKTGSDATVHLLPSAKGDASGAVLAIVPDGDESWRFIEVGRLADGRVTVTKAGPLAFGRPLFLEVAGRAVASRKDGRP